MNDETKRRWVLISLAYVCRWGCWYMCIYNFYVDGVTMKTIIIIFIGGVFLGALLKFLGIEAKEYPLQFIILLTFAEIYGIAIWESMK